MSYLSLEKPTFSVFSQTKLLIHLSEPDFLFFYYLRMKIFVTGNFTSVKIMPGKYQKVTY